MILALKATDLSIIASGHKSYTRPYTSDRPISAALLIILEGAIELGGSCGYYFITFSGDTS